MATPQRVPVAEQLFRWSDDGVDLVGSRCSGCGSHYFPKSLSCRNPACDIKEIEDVLFGRHGTLRSYTVQHYRPPALFRMDDWEPYVLGLVELPEGLRVIAMLSGLGPDDVRIDMPVRLVVEPLYADDDGLEVMTYKYARDDA